MAAARAFFFKMKAGTKIIDDAVGVIDAAGLRPLTAV
jgi:hypothetical protein